MEKTYEEYKKIQDIIKNRFDIINANDSYFELQESKDIYKKVLDNFNKIPSKYSFKEKYNWFEKNIFKRSEYKAYTMYSGFIFAKNITENAIKIMEDNFLHSESNNLLYNKNNEVMLPEEVKEYFDNITIKRDNLSNDILKGIDNKILYEEIKHLDFSEKLYDGDYDTILYQTYKAYKEAFGLKNIEEYFYSEDCMGYFEGSNYQIHINYYDTYLAGNPDYDYSSGYEILTNRNIETDKIDNMLEKMYPIANKYILELNPQKTIEIIDNLKRSNVSEKKQSNLEKLSKKCEKTFNNNDNIRGVKRG